MIRRLRKKFILINMLMAGAVLLTVLLLLIGTTLRQQEQAARDALTFALQMHPGAEEPRRFPAPGEEFPPGHALRPQEPNGLSSAFCVHLKKDGSIRSVTRLNLSLTDEDAQTAADAALSGGKPEGTLPHLMLSYRIEESPLGTRIAFVDRSMDRRMLHSLLISCGCVFVLAMLALFAVSLYLSRWALRPVQEAWDRQRQFVADASHELKTPLTVILANTGLLLNNADKTVASQRRWAENTRTEGLRMKKLVDDLLFLARADADRLQPELAPMNLSDAVWSAVLPFESVAFEKGQELKTDILPEVTATACAPQIVQAVSILMDNACKYAPAGSCITVRLQKTQSRAMLSVHNTGQPIPASALPHLFERFYRTDAARSREAGGYGLGLSILQTLCRANRCKITVDSTESGGTTFTLAFPLA